MWYVYVVCAGHVLGLEQRIHLRMLDIPMAVDAMTGVAMELQDCAYDLVDGKNRQLTDRPILLTIN